VPPRFALPCAIQLLEDHPLWDAGFVATESGWFVCRSLRRAQNCSKMGSQWDKVGVREGGAYSFYSGSLEDCPDDGVSVPALHAEILPIDGSFKRRASFGVSYSRKNSRT
jgi:hypothetical protein